MAAILSLKERDFQKLQFFLGKKLENEMISEFSFMGDDKELLMELVRAGQKDIAVDYMKKRAKNFLSNPAVIADIAYVESGKMPFTEEYYTRNN